jgi:hypothetical protein
MDAMIAVFIVTEVLVCWLYLLDRLNEKICSERVGRGKRQKVITQPDAQ